MSKRKSKLVVGNNINLSEKDVKKLADNVKKLDGDMGELDVNTKVNNSDKTFFGRISDFLNQNIVVIIVFFLSLFFIMSFSNPAIFINDEWITVNQLNQLDAGQQLIVNEGKYGTYLNGTPGAYFDSKDNLLGYTLMLPILSLPALKLFSLFGEQFRFFIVLLWSLIPIAMVFLVEKYRQKWLRVGELSLKWPLIITAFAFMLLNILLYYPFKFGTWDSPQEVAAVVFTNHIFFALTAVAIFLICRYMFKNDWYSVFGTIACMSCSSYMFWAANCKDHMITIAFTAFVILFMVRYIKSEKGIDAFCAFFFMGMLAWARPEVGAAVFVFSLIYYLGYNLYKKENRSEFFRLKIFAPMFTVLGAVPFFINNLYVTGNPLVPTFYVYLQKHLSAVDGNGNVIGSNIVNNVSYSVPAPSGGIDSFVNIVQNQMGFQVNTIVYDIFGVLLRPESGNVGVGIVCPLLFIGIVILPVLYFRNKSIFSDTDISLIIFLLFAVAAIWAAYFNQIYGMNHSHGVIPDIRYMTPAYIPMGLLGIFGVFSVFHKNRNTETINERKTALTMITSALTIVPAIILAMIFIQPYGGAYAGYTTFFMQLVYLMVVVTIIVFILVELKKISVNWFIVSVVLLVSIPLAWQFVMLFLYSTVKFNGYSFWIPFVENLYDNFIIVHDV
ncbi:hypothetical protein [Methanoplanus endosymbiosus]|uniref:Uncharacterized protein n=1 Tax=Methanoplanus endosymbiosus TaxID=33865 RepID=A0A9E7TL11_9EURY|nr:hypothetical protein [Methanoplanus endosymbiosus]UUX91816.1 hypothetical protein L6E24_10655 [Methanoplanus endosymbiosus]